VRVCACMWFCLCVWVCLRMLVCVCAFMYMIVCACVFVWVHVFVCVVFFSLCESVCLCFSVCVCLCMFMYACLMFVPMCICHKNTNFPLKSTLRRKAGPWKLGYFFLPCCKFMSWLWLGGRECVSPAGGAGVAGGQAGRTLLEDDHV